MTDQELMDVDGSGQNFRVDVSTEAAMWTELSSGGQFVPCPALEFVVPEGAKAGDPLEFEDGTEVTVPLDKQEGDTVMLEAGWDGEVGTSVEQVESWLQNVVSVWESFDEFDVDGSGTIDRDEFVKLLIERKVLIPEVSLNDNMTSCHAVQTVATASAPSVATSSESNCVALAHRPRSSHRQSHECPCPESRSTG